MFNFCIIQYPSRYITYSPRPAALNYFNDIYMHLITTLYLQKHSHEKPVGSQSRVAGHSPSQVGKLPKQSWPAKSARKKSIIAEPVHMLIGRMILQSTLIFVLNTFNYMKNYITYLMKCVTHVYDFAALRHHGSHCQA